MKRIEKELLQALQEIVAACSGEAIDEVERTHEGFTSSDAHAYTVGKVQAIAQNAISRGIAGETIRGRRNAMQR